MLNIIWTAKAVLMRRKPWRRVKTAVMEAAALLTYIQFTDILEVFV